MAYIIGFYEKITHNFNIDRIITHTMLLHKSDLTSDHIPLSV